MFHEQADVECGFSVNTNIIVENVSDESLTTQRFVQDHMKCKEGKPHNMPILNELLQSVKRSNASYKEALETKNKSQQKLETEIDEEFIQLKKESSLEETIKRYHLVRDRYALDADKKENRIIKDVKQLNRAATEKETELDIVLAKRKCLEDKRKIFHRNVCKKY